MFHIALFQSQLYLTQKNSWFFETEKNLHIFSPRHMVKAKVVNRA